MDTEQLALAIDRAIGAELRAQRERRRLSRAALGELSGISDKTIQRFEEGKRSPDVQQLVKLTAALETTMPAFVELALRDVEGLDPGTKAPTSRQG